MSALENIITDNLPIWSSTIRSKSSAGRGISSKQNLYGVKKLRELVLDLAVMGKLVPQDPSDEPASVLLEKIAAEKERLVKEGKIKKQKPTVEIKNKDKLFKSPKNWQWARLSQLSILENGDRSENYPNKAMLVENGIPFVNAGHLNHERIDVTKMTYITQDRFNILKAGKFRLNDILFCLRGSLGKAAIVTDLEQGAIASSLVIIRALHASLPFHLLTFFKSNHTSILVNRYNNGTAQPNLSAQDLSNFVVPIPPLSEQHRIVAKVDELMALCDTLEQQQEDSIKAHETLVEVLLETLSNAVDADAFQAAWARISEHFDALFTTEHSINKLKETILQLAVMGKLVPQDPSDEPASVLLEKIAAEKERLVKEGKIKKQNTPPKIGSEETPYGLPEGWCFSRILGISAIGTGGTPSRSESSYYTPKTFHWVTSSETGHDFLFDTKEFVSKKATEETNVTIYPIGTLIIAMYGQGKTRGQVTELMIEAGTNQACAAIQLIEKHSHHRAYIKLILKKIYQEIRQLAEGGAQPNLNLGKVSNFIVPIPPLAEQQRIVAKVDELMALSDQLKSSLQQAQETQIQLTDVVVKNAL